MIINGPWKSLTDCIGLTFQEATDETEADIVIKWGYPKNIFAVGETAVYFDKPTEIVLNRSCNFHLSLDGNVPSNEVDLYRVIAHELIHFFGLPDYNGSGTVTNGDYNKTARVLSPFDEAKFKALFSIIFVNETPHGKINDCRPNISVLVQSPCSFSAINASTITLKLDNEVIPFPPGSIVQQTNSSVKVSFTPTSDLSLGIHFVDIEASNADGSPYSYSWTFEIEKCCPTPGTPSSPSPLNGATGVATNPTLSWAVTSNTDSYDVYFGTFISFDPNLVPKVWKPSFPITSLAGGTTFYWQVVAVNSCGTSTAGPVWSFTTYTSVPSSYCDALWTDCSQQCHSAFNAYVSDCNAAYIACIGSCGPFIDIPSWHLCRALCVPPIQPCYDNADEQQYDCDYSCYSALEQCCLHHGCY